jgi:26S proteasome non-ATPase regulatory subunit 9
VERSAAPRAIAIVDELTAGSPAALGGMLVGDVLVSFGEVSAGELSQVAAVLQANENRPVAVVVQRQGVLRELSVTPRAWEGRGLLGCHMRALS